MLHRDPGAAARARRATENSPAIDRWETGPRDETSPVREEEGGVALSRKD